MTHSHEGGYSKNKSLGVSSSERHVYMVTSRPSSGFVTINKEKGLEHFPCAPRAYKLVVLVRTFMAMSQRWGQISYKYYKKFHHLYGRNMTRDGHAFVSSKLQFLFHLSSFALFAFVFSWHFGPEAAKLPQAGGFGWFYKFLTFCGFNFQLLTLFVVVLSHLFSRSEGLKQLADDLSCTIFPIANAISILYWGILIITMKPVDQEIDGNIHRTVTHGLQSSAPWYINLTVHLFNSIIVWIDISISERTFRTRAFFYSFAFAVGYICWSQYATSINKIYPYPFLNAMPQPQGYILVSMVSLFILYLFSRVGAKVAGRSLRAFQKTKTN